MERATTARRMTNLMKRRAKMKAPSNLVHPVKLNLNTRLDLKRNQTAMRTCMVMKSLTKMML